MNRKSLWIVLSALVMASLILSACAPAATPVPTQPPATQKPAEAQPTEKPAEPTKAPEVKPPEAPAGGPVSLRWRTRPDNKEEAGVYASVSDMGDTGSLAIGGTRAVISVLLKQEMLFPILGGLFLAEAFTSQIQDKIGVRWLGRRLFYRAPLHHNLQHKGIAETKVVIRLWIIAGILALLALATLKLR